MKRAGFTLLEMMIVILVVALLFLLTIPNVNMVMNLIQNKGCEAQLSVVDAAILQYFMMFDHYPTDINALIQEGLLSHEQSACQNGDAIGIINNQAAR
ncbi:MAG: prepilin-type N-terminal cleavage/methylation domain-containing protein [Erysipelothrix sp.]|jgi:competence protein ComGC|nr:prepilin-type N-terminal cleavage/methylation domain-containing protein [Erysipelothrix sp.]